MRGRTVRRAAPLIVAASLLAACGSSSGGTKAHNDSSAPPKTELSQALHAISQGSALTATFHFDTTKADLIKIDHEQGDSGSDAIPPNIAQAIATDHISMEVLAPAGTTLAQLKAPAAQKNERVAFTLGDNSANYFSLLVINRSLYAQLNLKYFLAAGGTSSQYAAIQRQVATAPAFVRDFIAGKWISLPYSTLQSIEGLAKGELGNKLPKTGKFAALDKTLISTLFSDLAVTRTSTGSTDQLGITANVRQVLKDEFTKIRPLITSLVGSFGASSLPTPKFAEIPSTNVHLTASVSGGALTKLAIDFGQFQTSPPHFSLPFEVDLSKSGAAINVPPGATPINFAALGQLFAASTSVSSTGGGKSVTHSIAPAA